MERAYRTAFAVGCAVACMALAGAPAVAQQYPTKSVRMIVGFPPGGGTDVVARVISQRLSDWWGQGVVVENRAGATGTVGAETRPGKFEAFIRAEVANYAKLVNDANIRLD